MTNSPEAKTPDSKLTTIDETLDHGTFGRLIEMIYYIAMMIAEVCIFFLENFWNEDFSDPGDDDEPDATT